MSTAPRSALPPLVAALAGLLAACVVGPRPGAAGARAFDACAGTPVVTVRNNTRQSVAVYALVGQRQTLLAEVPPGVQQLPVAPTAGAMYGARVGGASDGRWLAAEANPRLGQGEVRLERGCVAA